MRRQLCQAPDKGFTQLDNSRYGALCAFIALAELKGGFRQPLATR